MPLFKSTGVPGYSNALRAHPDCRSARKREGRVQVRFAAADGQLQSREGTVHVRAGDAILTGSHGEQWRVSKAHFDDKYQPVPPAQAGSSGTYASRPIQVLALQMPQAFEVLLADGHSTLRGTTGDWLLDYGDGSLGIVSQDIFTRTYDLVD